MNAFIDVLIGRTSSGRIRPTPMLDILDRLPLMDKLIREVLPRFFRRTRPPSAFRWVKVAEVSNLSTDREPIQTPENPSEFTLFALAG